VDGVMELSRLTFIVEEIVVKAEMYHAFDENKEN
jgi:hypothetical protein